MAVSHWKLARLEIGEKSIFTQKIAAEKQIGLIALLSPPGAPVVSYIMAPEAAVAAVDASQAPTKSVFMLENS